VNRRSSLLHLQLGQETIYLLLAASLASALILAIIAAQQSLRLAQLEELERRDVPPIIMLSEARGYFFRSGRADLTNEFRRQLRDIVIPQLATNRQDYGVTVIEVIGHTDEQPLGSTAASTLDFDLLPFIHGASNSDVAPPAADNVGLGMLRAAAVARELRADPRLAGMVILPLSAAQTTEVNDLLAEAGGEIADRERRRIEIRMRRSNS
jgi:hypothetical protein